MSILISSKVWKNGPEKQAQLLVMLALADFANDEGICWPSMETLARKVRMTERGTRKIVAKLKADGWIAVKTGGGRHGCNQYTVFPEQFTGNNKPGTQENPEHDSPKPGTEVQKTLNRGSAEPSGNTKELPSNSARTVLCEVLKEETADDFIAHRKAIKKPVTPQAAKQLVKKVEGLEDPDAAFNESIAKGWLGVFPKAQSSSNGVLFNLRQKKE